MPKGAQIVGENFNSQQNLIQLRCVGVTFREYSEMAQKTVDTIETFMEIFALEGDLSSEIRLMKTDNVTVTDFFDDYVHVHNTQTSLILRRITKEASLYIIQ